MTLLTGKTEELQQEVDTTKKLLKERTRTRHQLKKVLHDAAFAMQSMLQVSVNVLSMLFIIIVKLSYCHTKYLTAHCWIVSKFSVVN